MMTKPMQTISSFKEGDYVDETYLVVSKQVSIAKNGGMYLSVKLADKTGEVDGKMWDNAEEVASRFEKEDFVRIKGVAANYQGTMQVKMKALEKIDDAKVDLANFLESSPRNIDEMVGELAAFAEAIRNTHLRQLMGGFLTDKSFMAAFRRVPAAKALHHNYIGGLLEHVVELVALVRDVARHFPGIDTDLLTVGAFLHDVGKVRELSVRKSIEYTTEGRLLGHISLGYEMVAEKIKAIHGFPDELTMLLKHIMLSHHGEYEFGSPKRPKIQEAVIINYLDDLAAKISNFRATLKRENVDAGEWTYYSKMHDRYLYRQGAYGAAGGDEGREPEKSAGKKDANASGGGTGSTGNLPLDI
ncbi:MAG: 3'-5' exoribonuclease YhaM family protein [Nitrospirota bacterium]